MALVIIAIGAFLYFSIALAWSTTQKKMDELDRRMRMAEWKVSRLEERVLELKGGQT